MFLGICRHYENHSITVIIWYSYVIRDIVINEAEILSLEIWNILSLKNGDFLYTLRRQSVRYVNLYSFKINMQHFAQIGKPVAKGGTMHI